MFDLRTVDSSTPSNASRSRVSSSGVQRVLFVWTGPATSRIFSHRTYKACALRCNPLSLANWAQNSLLELRINDASSPRIASRSRESSSVVQRSVPFVKRVLRMLRRRRVYRACGLRCIPVSKAN